MKRVALLLLVLVNGFIVCDVFILSPQESLLFKPQVRERLSVVFPMLKRYLLPEREAVEPEIKPVLKDDSLPPAPIIESFVPPVIEPLEKLTQDWKHIPMSAFPREVELRQAVEFRMAGGASRLPSGSKVMAISAESGVLTLSPTSTSPARASMPMQSTDFQDQIRRTYEQWAAQAVESARRKWERSRQNRPVPSAANMALADGQPRRAADGSYPLLLASMAAGDVTEITPKKVIRWGAPMMKDVNGKPTWCVDVKFKTVVYCGPIDADAQAQIQSGKVVAWIYPGSGEPVP